jgi:hypothetical protein
MIEQLIDMAVSRPWVGWLALIVFWLLGMGVILCLVAMLRRDKRGQAADHEEQWIAITRPAALDKPTHRVHIQPAADNIPWTRRVQPPGPGRRT